MMFAVMTATSKSSIPLPSSGPRKSGMATTAGAETSPTHVALLRGINVGGKNMLPMRELEQIFAKAGCSGMRSYLQSGNVVFTAEAEVVKGLGARVAGKIAARFGLRVPVILQSAEEMRAAVTGNPLLKAGADPGLLHLYFLEDLPAAGAVKGLDYERSAGDTYVVAGRHIYLHLPAGVARTKLTNVYFDRMLGTVSTMRNWKTVTMLAGMVAAA